MVKKFTAIWAATVLSASCAYSQLMVREAEVIGYCDVEIIGTPLELYLSVEGAVDLEKRTRYQVLNIDISIAIRNADTGQTAFVADRLDFTHPSWVNEHEWDYVSKSYDFGSGRIVAAGEVRFKILDIIALELQEAVICVEEIYTINSTDS